MKKAHSKKWQPPKGWRIMKRGTYRGKMHYKLVAPKSWMREVSWADRKPALVILANRILRTIKLWSNENPGGPKLDRNPLVRP